MSSPPCGIVPFKAAQNELWVECALACDIQPGQIVRIESDAGPCAYGQVCLIEVQAAPMAPAGPATMALRVSVTVLAGAPSMKARTMTVLTPAEVAQAAALLLSPMAAPLHMGTRLVGDAGCLGALTLLEGDAPAARRALIRAFAEAISTTDLAGRTVLVMDPCGLMAQADDLAHVHAGTDVRLSLQALGMSAFLTAMEQALPPTFREEALHVLVKGMPLTLDFIPFQYLLSPKRYWESPAKLPLLHALYGIHQNHAFADRPEEMFLLEALPSAPITVLDLSSLQDPWREVFYRFVCQALLQQPGYQTFPILIEPETLLDAHFLSGWLQQFEKRRGHGVAIASACAPGAGYALTADSRLVAVQRPTSATSYDVTLCGRLSAQMPVTLVLGAEHPSEPSGPDLPEGFSGAVSAEPAHFSPFPESPVAVPQPPPAASAITEFETEADWLAPPAASAGAETPALETDPTPAMSLFDVPRSDTAVIEPTAVLAAPLPEPLPEDPLPPVACEVTPTADAPPPVAIPASVPEAMLSAPLPDETPPPALDTLSIDDLYPPPAAPMPSASGTSQAADLDVLFQADATAGQGTDEWGFDFEPDFEPVAPSRIESLGEPGLVEASPPARPVPSPLPPEPQAAPIAAVPASSVPLPPVEPIAAPEPLPVYQNTQPEAQAAREKAGYQPGDRVVHPQYGTGVVEKVIPMDGRVTLKVTFAEVGKRLLDADSAPLRKSDAR